MITPVYMKVGLKGVSKAFRGHVFLMGLQVCCYMYVRKLSSAF